MSFYDPQGYKVFARTGGLNKVPYAKEECEAFRKSIQTWFFLGGILWFLFLKHSRVDSNIAGKNTSKQLGDPFIVVTGWQLGDPEAISGYLEPKNSDFQLIIQ